MCLAIPGKLIERHDVDGSLVGKVAFGGVMREVSLDFLPEAELGDYVLVHVGFAISRVDAEEAATTFAYLEQAGLLNEELGLDAESSPGVRLQADPEDAQMAHFPREESGGRAE